MRWNEPVEASTKKSVWNKILFHLTFPTKGKVLPQGFSLTAESCSLLEDMLPQVCVRRDQATRFLEFCEGNEMKFEASKQNFCLKQHILSHLLDKRVLAWLPRANCSYTTSATDMSMEILIYNTNLRRSTVWMQQFYSFCIQTFNYPHLTEEFLPRSPHYLARNWDTYTFFVTPHQGKHIFLLAQKSACFESGTHFPIVMVAGCHLGELQFKIASKSQRSP